MPKPRCVHGEEWNACRYCPRYEYRKVEDLPGDAFRAGYSVKVEVVAIPGETPECRCCCDEHTDDSCPARAVGACRGQP